MADGAPYKAFVSFAVLIVLGGCGRAPRYFAPDPFTVSNNAVAEVVRDAVASDRWAAQLEGTPRVTCTGRTTCNIGYTVQRAIGPIFQKAHAADSQLILPTAQMWKAMFNDPQFQSGSITVKGPAFGSAETESATYFTLSCDRAVASKINWDNVDGHGIRTHCDYAPQTKGLPGFN